MNPKIVEELISHYRALANLYRTSADDACNSHSTYDVYLMVKESIALETKIRALKVRYLITD